MSEKYDIGDRIESTGTFRNAAKVLTNPTTARFKIRKPDGTETTLQFGVDGDVTNPSTGVFKCPVTFDAAGSWYLRWVGTGAIVAAVEDEVVVEVSQFTTPT